MITLTTIQREGTLNGYKIANGQKTIDKFSSATSAKTVTHNYNWSMLESECLLSALLLTTSV